jgi:hypothetical protein
MKGFVIVELIDIMYLFGVDDSNSTDLIDKPSFSLGYDIAGSVMLSNRGDKDKTFHKNKGNVVGIL